MIVGMSMKITSLFSGIEPWVAVVIALIAIVCIVVVWIDDKNYDDN